MEEKTCQSCKYYHQHYGISGGRIYRVFCGHCACGRVKTKRPYAAVCENYIYSESRESEFVTKEYLSKALLLRVLNMDLLPPIEDGEVFL